MIKYIVAFLLFVLPLSAQAKGFGSVISYYASVSCSVTETPETTCNDSTDNDCDGLIDCLDSDCDAVGSCEYGTELTCDDSIDNDGDGLTDGADPDCPTYALFYDVDHASGTNYAYTAAGTGSLQGTITGATPSSAYNHTPGGTYSLMLDASNERISFPITTKDIFDSTHGYIELYVRCGADVTQDGNDTFFETSYDASNYFSSKIEADHTQYTIWRESATNDVIQTATTTDITTAWTHFEFRWQSGGNVEERKNDGSWETAGTISAFANEPSAFIIGELDRGGINDTIYIDDFKIWVTYDKQ